MRVADLHCVGLALRLPPADRQSPGNDATPVVEKAYAGPSNPAGDSVRTAGNATVNAETRMGARIRPPHYIYIAFYLNAQLSTHQGRNACLLPEKVNYEWLKPDRTGG